jgi:hypothetical protein
LAGAIIPTAAELAAGATPFPLQVEPCECVRESVAGQRCDVVLAGLIQELGHFVFPNRESTKSPFDPLHRQREEHQQHWEEDHSESLHTGK